MSYTLENFYTSDSWVRLTHILRLERLNEEGDLICWHCGKPIVKKYDAIAHHLTFLTEDNVNDAEVALNPDLIRFVHHRCHNYIHNKLGYTKQEVYLIYGCPFSGKHDYLNKIIDPADLLLDIDAIWRCVSIYMYGNKPPKLNPVVFGIRDYMLDCIRVRRGRWDNAYIIGGYPLVSERERLCRSLGAREIYIDSTKEQCLKRLGELNEQGKVFDVDECKRWVDEWWNRYNLKLYG